MSLKTRLTEILHYMRDQQIALPDRISPEDRDAVGTAESHSAKDAIFHNAVWAGRFMTELEAIEAGDTSQNPQHDGFEEADRQIFEQYRDHTWDQAPQMVNDVYGRMDAYLDRNSEETLMSVPQGKMHSIFYAITSYYINNPMITLTNYFRQQGYRDLSEEIFGLEFGIHMAQLADPDRREGTTLYNLACFSAGAGNKEEAIETLAKALRLAPDLTEWSKHDPDFDAIRDDPAFQALYE